MTQRKFRNAFNRDVMNMATPRSVARASMATLNSLQDHRPEVQIMALAATFLSLAEQLGIPAQEAFSATKNLINDDNGKRSEFKALDAYINGELV